ncbi:BA75_00765T0 [Komagataella pastoris]|uniref:BA75_00765T0 n=1 Tax=Komagataella pastoris TaxID=4922 RepID=A0A1B2J9J4_PICPA|nr:BA75_00765T0 [Komagataella pastoris]
MSETSAKDLEPELSTPNTEEPPIIPEQTPELQFEGASADEHENEPQNPAENALHPEPSTVASSANVHRRTASSSTINSSQMGSATIGFIKSSFEKIVSKCHKKDADLKVKCTRIIEKLNSGDVPEVIEIFEPLNLACQSKTVDIKVTALDCLGKMFTFNVFSEPQIPESSVPKEMLQYWTNILRTQTKIDQAALEGTALPYENGDTVPLIDIAIETIAECFEGEGTNEKVELQVVKVLMAAVLSETMAAHGAVLLRAVRQIYNIFILSLSPANQGVAQASLTQIFNIIFERVHRHDKSNGVLPSKSGSFSNINNIPTSDIESQVLPEAQAPKLTLENLENLTAGDELAVAEANKAIGEDKELAVKDAFLIFRAMCKLSVKPIEVNSIDMRSHELRSKLLSLHIIHTILQDHLGVFLNKRVMLTTSNQERNTTLIDAIKQYLCLSLSRNAASPLAPIYEISLEIFWIILSKLRFEFKREIAVFIDEIYFPVLEMKSSATHQKRYFLAVMNRLFHDPKAVIELYLNYDCDSQLPSLCEGLIDYLTRFSLTRVEISQQQKINYKESLTRSLAVYSLKQSPMLSIKKLGANVPDPEASYNFPGEYAIVIESIECVVLVLQSLSTWVDSIAKQAVVESEEDTALSVNGAGEDEVLSQRSESATQISETSGIPQDPAKFDTQKQRKTALFSCVKAFNYKPKIGIAKAIESGFIKDDSPQEIAKFLLYTDGLDKTQIGEYLGEGDEKNITIMHDFVDLMDFSGLEFVEAMRMFLQNFRLPGESQKIDRFMLKFAERFVLNNPGTFANADVPYVLAYSVILLNTDQHSAQVKRRMSLQDFIRNNAGIDDGQDLPETLLSKIYYEIQSNEIKLQSEQQAALLAGNIQPEPVSGLFSFRNQEREQYMLLSKELTLNTEKVFKSFGQEAPNSNIVYYYATKQADHVLYMFHTLWMSIFAGLTPPFKEYDDEDTTKLCIKGIKLAIHLSCTFDIENARSSFVSALVQFGNLHNVEEISPKNVDAIHALLNVAVTEGDHLRGSWKEILLSVSQIERIQLLAQGIDSGVVPDISIARMVNRASLDSVRTRSTTSTFFSSPFGKQKTLSEQAYEHYQNQKLKPSIVPLITSTELTVAMDKIFSHSSQISGDAIIDFVKALCQVSSDEIESSGRSESPRMFSLQKMVDVCYYNMGRIRFQWSNLWAIMGDTFNRFGTHSNTVIVFFALDSLRQLSMRFFDIEELAHFKFQKEFLKPFEFIIGHTGSEQVKDMILDCLGNMVQTKADKIRSGWTTMFETLTIAAGDYSESIVMKSYKLTALINEGKLDDTLQQGTFESFVHTLTALAKNQRFQKISLHALQDLKKLINRVSDYTLDENNKVDDEVMVQLWFPILFGFHDVIMTGDDLEVRSRALNYMFDALVQNGGHFDPSFWDKICNELLFPIFKVLSEHWQVSQFDTQDDISVWLSTTLIQALRNMVALFTHYFDTLNRMLDGYLELLISCICQENDTIARIGRSCLEQLIVQNAKKFTPELWDKITDCFERLFDLTLPKELFDDANANSKNGNGDVNSIVVNGKSSNKSTIVVKCVLQLLLIETMAELFDDDGFYDEIPFENVIRLSKFLNQSYEFARDFNDDYNLRVRFFNGGVIDNVPNLLKQETSASAVYFSIMLRLYCDDNISEEQKEMITQSLLPMWIAIVERYTKLDDVTQQRNISTWRPVVIEILQGFVELDEKDFIAFCPAMYELVLGILDKSLPSVFRSAIKAFFSRVGSVYISEKEEELTTDKATK